MTHSVRGVSLWPALLLVACAGSVGSSGARIDDAGDSKPSDSLRPDGGAPGDGSDGGNGKPVSDGGGAGSDGDSGADAGSGCLRVCPAQACGHVADGCGAFLTCGACAEGEICGLLEPDRCAAVPSSCTPRPAAEVCAGKCGATSDGCSDVILCDGSNGGVTCSADQICGGYAGALQPNACVDKPSCVPLDCASLGVECGLEGDGCGGLLDCTAQVGCPSGQICGTGAMSGQCVDIPPPQCEPLTLEQACADSCGTVGDGCEGTLECSCPDGTSCGGGNVAGECGSGGVSCTPFAIADVCAGKCGSQPDGCGSVYVCSTDNGGQSCNSAQGESCGGGGTPNVCGKPPCTPKTMQQACPGSGGHDSCGLVADGCGDMIQCGGCGSGQTCGLTSPNLCGQQPSCQPVSASSACAGKCETVPNGCGGSYSCGPSNGGESCSGDEYCGAITPNECGEPVRQCVPKTCAQLGHSCGLATDGCGEILNCWPGCSASNQSCSGSCGEVASCLADDDGVQSCVAAEGSCTGSLCDHLPTGCASDSPTQLKGVVRTPGRQVNNAWINQLPVPNALVYIPSNPSAALPAIFEGAQSGVAASCGRCEDEQLVVDGETLLAAAVTNFKGEFTLEGRIPVGTAFNLVIKVGKWRRVVQVPAGISSSCSTKNLALDYTRLAANTQDGLSGTHLPKIAVSTGDVDAMECVLRGMGISDSEFSVPSGSGRIHMYRANGARMGSAASDKSVADTTLYAAASTVNAYDMIVFDCEGNGHKIRDNTSRGRILNYVNAGGRLFASHWSYEWLDNNDTLDQAAAWNKNGSNTSATGYVSLPSGATQRSGANPVKSLMYRDWLDWQGALSGTVAGQLTTPSTPQMTITDPRDVAGATVGSSTDEWMYRNSSGAKVQQLSFNTPYGSAENAICGRVAFSAFHVAANGSGTTLSTGSLYFPGECNNAALTPQEKTLAFMLFDLASCVSAGDPPAPPACTPKTSDDLCPTVNAACSFLSDGCGGVVDCGGCASGFYCDGNTCRAQQCTPATCSSLGYNCGSPADGCGGIARDAQGHEGCGTCSEGQACGLGGPGLCGSSGCRPIAEEDACPSNWCGLVSNGCGGTYDCGACSSGVCGGGGASQCGQSSCTPIPFATACANKNCGLVSNGCGGTHDCGACVAPLSCGGGGTANVCGKPSCTPFTKAQACDGLQCGWVSNGCGGAISCGSCPGGGVCGGGGANMCGSSCTPRSCGDAGAQCGAISDHCGAITQCGSCPAGKTCGAGGANKCGNASCTPTTCNLANAECGLIGDGCGGVLDCGTCSDAGETCGGAGVANHCGAGNGGCNPLSCEGQNVECGAASDGCGGLLDCGGCGVGGYCQRGECLFAPQ